MVDAGSRQVEDDWSMLVDVTDDLDSIVSAYACKDVERMQNGIGKYIRLPTWQTSFKTENHVLLMKH